MKIADVLPQLTILPLRRFADAWAVSTIKSDKRDVFEQAILGEIKRIDTDASILQRLRAFERELDYSRWRTSDTVLRMILNEPGYAVADEADLIERAIQADTAFFEYASASTSTRHIDPRVADIFQSVLEVAWEDRVSFDEKELIKRLQRKLGICRRDHRIMEVKIGALSQMGPPDAERALRDLNYQGFVCQFKHRGHNEVVIPEEIALRLRTIYGIALQAGAYRNLAAKVPIAAIKQTLEEAAQPAISLKKDFLVDRLIDGDVGPAQLLDHLPNEALDGLFANFPDHKMPSMRAVKIRHLVSLFDRFGSQTPNPTPEADPDKTYYTYLVELGSRQYEVLRSASVIQHDQNVDRAFERGVRYAFSALLGHPPLEFTGSAHADGGIAAKNGRMVLWDCKSALTPYALTEAKCAQFLQYVAKELPNIVCPFLVISGSFTEDSAVRALALKANCPPGTEIGLIASADLKWLAEKWSKEYAGRILPPDVLAHTGAISREVLDVRLKLFGGQSRIGVTS